MGEPIHDAPLNGHQIPAAHIQPPIAVVGMGCRLPGRSNSPQALWDFISKGSVADNTPPASRYNYATHYDGSGRAGTTPSPGAMFLGDDIDIAAFDAAFFNTSHQEAGSIDPQQRQLLEVIYECLENSGETLERIQGANVGCIVANNGCEYESGTTRDPEDQIPGRSTGCGRSILANRVSHFLDITGPSISLDTACSGTLVAVDMACRYLQFEQADAMIVAGALLYLDPSAQQDRGPMNGALSNSGKCHTFDAKADGYMRAEGINAVYLKRLDDAIRDRDPIRSVIRGSATTGDGRTSSLTQPNPEAQAKAIRAAYRNAGISDVNETGYVECHGTGTLAGDPLEIAGLASVFASTRPVDKPLIIGSIKSNIGHSECAAGLSGLIKAVMAVERGLIPGNPTFMTPNPTIDFEKSRVRASREAIEWPSHAVSPRRASVNSFGFGGSNAHVVLEAADTFIQQAAYCKSFTTSQFGGRPPRITQAPPEKHCILTFSANDKETLPKNIEALSDHLSTLHVDAQLDDIAYTLSDRRTHHFHRGFIITESLDFDPGSVIVGKRKAQIPRVGFVFTGQGAQWSQMGERLINTFPLAKSVVEHLDTVLQALPRPPNWSLITELTEKRDPAILRLPEFSQPLVTALQIAMLAVLQDWGITGHKVLGHSSGEIAAAVAANLINPEDAIKTAFLRGQAAKNRPPKEALGMMAVGISAADAERYLLPGVDIACFNSPTSLTLSGPVPALEHVRDAVQKDGHFARLLQVDMAYHSEYMRDIANDYHGLLKEHCPASTKQCYSSSMLSSVTGRAMTSQISPDYWKANMLNPVRFADPAASMLTGPDACEFIVEIGPSSALAGPLAQVMKTLPGGGKNVQYAAVAKRGPDTLTSLFEVAGKLWASGGSVNLSRVNSYDRPSLIVDLPNYQWNHSKRYWREGLSTTEYRHRPFISHELLGSKVLSTSWQCPTWTKTIHLSDLPWLRDHRINDEIVFPVGGYLAMAAEAVRQATVMTEWSSRGQPECFSYKMKDIEISQRLVLGEAEGVRMMLILAPVHGSSERWYTFTIQTHQDKANVWVPNCEGLIRIDKNSPITLPSSESLRPLEYSEPGSRCYKKMKAMGCDFGPHFQQIEQFQAAPAGHKSRGILSTNQPEHNSMYPIHPVTFDAFIQLCGLSLQQSIVTAGETVALTPLRIGAITFPETNTFQKEFFASILSQYSGKGPRDSRRNQAVSGQVFQADGGTSVMEMNTIEFDTIKTEKDCYTEHSYTRYQWDADISLTSARSLNNVLRDVVVSSNCNAALHKLFDLVSHQTPEVSTLEVNMDGSDTSCLWLGSKRSRPCTSYHRLTSSETAVAVMQGRYATCQNAEFQALDVVTEKVGLEFKHDFVILKVQDFSPEAKLRHMFTNVSQSLKEEGQLLIVGLPTSAMVNAKQVLAELGCTQIKDLTPSVGEGAILTSTPSACAETQSANTFCLRLAADNPQLDVLLDELDEANQKIISTTTTESIPKRSNILILDELFTTITADLLPRQLSDLQDLVNKECNILWVTSGAQMNITNPDRAATTGFLRTLRMEEVHLRIIALDVETSTGPETIPAIETCLRLLVNPEGRFRRESEFAERSAVIHTPRLIVDEELEEAKYEHMKERASEMKDLQGEICLQLETRYESSRASYVEVELASVLQNTHIEVEVFAASVPPAKGQSATTTVGYGLAGIVAKVGNNVLGLSIGQRVVLLHDAVANRVQVPAFCAQSIPDSMPFESAASVPAAWFTSLHALTILADLQRGQRLLIHSTGDVNDLAAVVIAQRKGAEVFVSAPSPEAQRFFQETVALSPERILLNGEKAFKDTILRLTKDEGVNVAFGSFKDDSLGLAWDTIAAGGTLVTVGCTGSPGEAYLPMEPFARGASIKVLDPTKLRTDPNCTGRLFKEAFELMEDDVSQSTTLLSISDFKDANTVPRRKCSSENDVIVLSRAPGEPAMVPVHPRPRTLKFKDNACYLLIGGLKGLCGSIAIDFAMRGAKHLAVMSRSGHDDEASRMVVRQIESLGCHIDLLRGDITNLEDVRRVFTETALSVAGIIQGSMVLRDRPFPVMTIDEYHEAASCKITGTWNLHNVAQELNLTLDFFTLLSSISSVLGGMAQANYAAGCAFLDAFAAYRRSLGLPAFSVNLGIIGDVGYMARDEALLERHIGSVTTSIEEDLMRQILRYTIMQQSDEPVSCAATTNIVTGIAVPQSGDSYLRLDNRFSHLFVGGAETGTAEDNGSKDSAQHMKDLKIMLGCETKAFDRLAAMEALTAVISEYIAHTMRLSEPVEPDRSLAMYGIDSLATVAFRNWVRMELGAGLSTVEVTMAPSLVALCERILNSLHGGKS